MLEYRDALKALKVIPLDKLVYPEEASPEIVEDLKERLRFSEFFTTPIVVDRKTYIVLDGVHRAKAIAELGYPNALCQLVDLQSPKLCLRTWYPVFCCANIDELRGAVATREVKLKEGMRDVRAMKAAFLLVFDRGRGKECLLVEPSKKPMSACEFFAAQKHALARFSQRHGVRYIPDESDDEFLQNSCAIILRRRTFTKKEMLASVLRRGLVLPPKTTRFILPMRVAGVDMPFEWLQLDPQEAQDRVDAELRKRSEQWGIRLYSGPQTLMFNEYALD